ncbi:MAG TPA: WD40 repeat domain-containing protein [Leptolyngbyaceae cyanobacterium M65_K2018_010]|nr:WD40 repeat domain-containing protein [Leptolyngbyaceae cyanobacterium M65_K2018_010]
MPVDMEALPAMVISPNGQYLAASRQDFSVTVWEIPTRRPCYSLPPLDAPVWTLVFSADSSHLVTGSDYRLRLWNAKTGHSLRSFISQAHPVSCLALTPEGEQLLTGHSDTQLRLWPLQPPVGPTTTPQPLIGHSKAILALAVSPNGQWIASAAADQTVGLWHQPTSRCVHMLNTTASLLSFSPDSNWLASTGHTPQVALWQVATGLPVDHWLNPAGVCSALLLSPDTQWIVSGNRDGTISVWSFPPAADPRVFRGHRRQVHSLAVSQRGNILASASYDGTVRWWDLTTGQSLGTWQHPDGHWIHQVISNPEEEFVAITSLSSDVDVWAVQRNQICYSLRGHSHDIWGVSASPDGSCLATASQDYEIRVWSLSQGHCQRVLRPDRPYEGVNIRGASGLSTAETAMLKSLGAIVSYSA